LNRLVGRYTYGKSLRPERHHPQAPNLIFPPLKSPFSMSLILAILIPLMIGVEMVERMIHIIDVKFGKKRYVA
jgi:hypothetical protein